ncbi:hypothetical protein KO504_02060 [Winogradskyella psychrotolerans]|uniref:hypothetical protein n=1 Tax=Winogradskyella psychrotolerans TaxID=1344585 RepID=UPI001C06DB36|nr:hypothetical protein [Winogradskyella psychrotolerans]MBU2920116.1 hypothetical protein [Winogradskyella psychrotolerans]|eukprot:TRINITY_DN6490_c0_g2_i3.p1 TRINITY_DN6490_c0_g2~~TRINITY_DN6490_c0_g2_i3.p1  ORF type:complete len:158 (+),score=39.14 TRINITY_DN6490_c0_g2_i3:519-992(+)
MKKLTLLFFAIILISCSSDDDKTSEDNENTGFYKIEYTSQLSDADLNLDITFLWNDENGQPQSETTQLINPAAYTELADEKTVEISNLIGITFKVNSGSNYLSDTYVKITNIDNNSSYEVTNSESIASTGGAIDNNTLTVTFNTENNTFESVYSTSN